jgi:DNA topoisomerase I
MSKNLVIVESPAKAKTISKFLGKDYVVKASMGHVRDLPKSKMGIDIESNFEPTYVISPDKKKVIKDLKSHIKKDTIVWIATDRDREGEAIGWHLLEALKIKDQEVHRIEFHEITKSAILHAIENPHELNQDLINAQQSRRFLDRLVGYELSPLLWKKIRYGLSAGRVQSVVVRLIVDRERVRDAFVPEESWSITGHFFPKGDKKHTFEAKLQKHNGEVIKMTDEKSSKKILKELEGCNYSVAKIEHKEVKRNPAAPFITSTLQQEAARKLRMSLKKTMMLAQQLYEGMEIGNEHQGLITYMRTDSVMLSKEATTAMTALIKKEYGDEYALDKPRTFKNKKGAQEAHEAIRPVDVNLKPSDLTSYLDKDQMKLYELIWKRAMASQMAPAVFDRVSIDIESNNGYQFRASGQQVKFPGFIKVYVEGQDDPDAAKEHVENLLPVLEKAQVIELKEHVPAQHFTKPPARFTEASLVKKLESEGVGRPSTYAPTITTVMSRGYVEKQEGTLAPTDTAYVVTDMLIKHFPNVVDIGFTSSMEDELDKIAEGKLKWELFLLGFYKPFHAVIEEKMESIKKEDVVNEATDEKCELCGKNMMIKLGRFGKFLSCSDYPECKNAKPLNEDPEKTKEFEELSKKLGGKKCTKCSEPMEVKRGRYGEFLGCTGYPKCKNMQSIVKFADVKCPKCEGGGGQLIERRTRKGGKLFYGCNKFPKCKYALWDKPLDKKCKACKSIMVLKGEKEVCSECKKEA